MEETDRHPFYSCRNCRNPLAFGEDLLSKAFWAKSGRAFMFSHVMNVVIGPRQDKQLITGLFSIADIFCSKCGEELGWKYLQAYDVAQRYKEGKFIVEKLKIIPEN